MSGYEEKTAFNKAVRASAPRHRSPPFDHKGFRNVTERLMQCERTEVFADFTIDTVKKYSRV
jgi:hypothetical protein